MNYIDAMGELATQTRLIEVAIEHFGQGGFSAVGTRAIAQAAGVPMSAITYHFGGKDGLYLACARHIAAEITLRIEPILAATGAADTDSGDVRGARASLLAMLAGMVGVMLREDIAPMASFVVREQMNPTPAFDIIFEGPIRRVSERMAHLIQRIAGGSLAPDELHTRTHALLGQVMAFRFARATLMRATGWKAVGDAEVAAVRATVLAHAEAILDGLQPAVHA